MLLQGDMECNRHLLFFEIMLYNPKDMENKKSKKGGIPPFLKGPEKGPSKNQFWGNILSTVLILLILVTTYSLIVENKKEKVEIPISVLAQDIKGGLVSKIVVAGEKLTATYKEEDPNAQPPKKENAEPAYITKESKKEAGTALSDTLVNYGVTAGELSALEIEIKKESGFGYFLLNAAPFLIPIIFILLFFWLISRQMKGAGMQAFNFGQSKT